MQCRTGADAIQRVPPHEDDDDDDDDDDDVSRVVVSATCVFDCPAHALISVTVCFCA